MAFLPIPQCPPTGQTGGWAFFVHRPRLSGCGRPARRGADPRRGVRFDNGCVFVYNHYKSKIFCEFCPPPFGDREESNVTYTVDDKMKTLLAAPEAVAVLERFFPKILKNPALQMTAAMTLRQVAGFAQSGLDRKSTRLNSSHRSLSRMPSSA